jgi:transketolase
MTFGPRRSVVIDIGEETAAPAGDLQALEVLDRSYRALCAALYNYAPLSGHPGGSISSGRIVAALLFRGMDYDLGAPDRLDADMIVYAAGHKALGMYAMWALRDEVARLAATELLPDDLAQRLRFEDLLGYRRNPTTATTKFRRHGAKALDGHPTPATPFVRLATGASGVGLGNSVGLAIAARDVYGAEAPRVHVIEGGLTPGRVSEALAAAGTACLDNLILHVDWNQSSIDSDRVCRDDEGPGDYVQWDPAELLHLHDWNVIRVPDGADLPLVLAAQRRAATLDNGQPTAVVYRTVKGWSYGIEGRASHGAGHGLCSEGFYQALAPLWEGRPRPDDAARTALPTCQNIACGGTDAETIEACYWEALQVIRGALAEQSEIVETLADNLRRSRERLISWKRTPRSDAPRRAAIFTTAMSRRAPEGMVPTPGADATLRGALGDALGHLNGVSNGAVLAAAADLLDSTSVRKAAAQSPPGFWNARTNPGARVLATGGICEDAMAGILSGLSTFGQHLGVGSSYGAFLAPLGHIPARLHAIGQQAREERFSHAYNPMVLVCGHAGLETGEDGPTHADPQALQVLQGNFPAGALVTLIPWEPREVWPLLAAGLKARPAVLAPFVTRPPVPVLDRAALGLAPADAAMTGLYRLCAAKGAGDGVIVLQGSGVTYAFVRDVLPALYADGVDLDVYYVASEELFDRLPPAERDRIFPPSHAARAMGITGFTLPTMYRWITSSAGRMATLHPFKGGRYLGSGQAAAVLHQAGLDGPAQLTAIRAWLKTSS